MHIASAAPDEEEKQGIPHHLIEFLPPDKTFSVADYVCLAKEFCREIASRQKAVILAGGTGLYINSLLDNITFDDVRPDMALREKLNREYDEKGGEAMLEELRRFDPESADRLHPNNNKRIIRAFEIYLLALPTRRAITSSPTEIKPAKNFSNPPVAHIASPKVASTIFASYSSGVIFIPVVFVDTKADADISSSQVTPFN